MVINNYRISSNKRRATILFTSSVFEISATCMVLFRPVAEISVTIRPPVAEKIVSFRPQAAHNYNYTLRARAPPRANIDIRYGVDLDLSPVIAVSP